jgi:hypothetical protein
MAILWAYFAPLLYLTGLTGTLIYAFKKKFNFQVLLPVAIVSATLFVYFLTFIFHNIVFGVVLTALASLVFVPLLILDKNRQATVRDLVLTPGFLVFILLYTLLFAFHYYSVLQIFSDDTMHWGPHVWTMWLRNDFYTSPNVSIVTHGDYPPILQLFQLIWCRIAGAYREGFLYMALEITCFSMLLPVLKNLSWQRTRNVKAIILSTLFCVSFLALPVSLDVTHLFYNALHPDYAIAFVFIAAIYFAHFGSRKLSWDTAVILSLIVSFLCLTKQSSVLFGGLALVIYVAGLYMHTEMNIRVILNQLRQYVAAWRIHWLKLVLAVVLLLLPLLSLKLWAMQIKGFKAPYCCVAIFHIGLTDTLKVPGVLLRETGDKSQQNYARNYFRYILTYQAGITLNLISNVSYTQFILLFIGVMIFIGYNYRDKFKRSRFIITTAVLVLGWFAYSFSIYLTFLFGGMIDSERDNLLTDDRYLRTYIFALLLFMFTLLAQSIVKRYNVKELAGKTIMTFSVALLVIISLLFNVDILKSGYVVESLKFNRTYPVNGISSISGLSEHMRTFTKSIGTNYSHPQKVAVTDKPDTQSVYYDRYLLVPNRMPNGSDLAVSKKTTQKAVCTILQNNDYLFISYTNSSYLDMINGCISNKLQQLHQYDAFKIVHNNGSLQLTPLHYQ